MFESVEISTSDFNDFQMWDAIYDNASENNLNEDINEFNNGCPCNECEMERGFLIQFKPEGGFFKVDVRWPEQCTEALMHSFLGILSQFDHPKLKAAIATAIEYHGEMSGRKDQAVMLSKQLEVETFQAKQKRRWGKNEPAISPTNFFQYHIGNS